MDPLNAAVIGCGAQGQVLIASLLLEALPGVRIQALCDIWPRNLEKTRKLLADHARIDLTGHTYEDYRQPVRHAYGSVSHGLPGQEHKRGYAKRNASD